MAYGRAGRLATASVFAWPYGRLGVLPVNRDDPGMHKTPRWWSVSPPTPPEAPNAKRRTQAQWRGTVLALVAAAAAFGGFILFLLLRVGRQVGAVESAPASLVVPVVASTEVARASSVVATESMGGTEAGAPSATGSAAPGRPRRDSEVFRKPGF
jgi:hypothetical protein